MAISQNCKDQAHELLILYEILNSAANKTRSAAHPLVLPSEQLTPSEQKERRLEATKTAELGLAFVNMGADTVKARLNTPFTQKVAKIGEQLTEAGESGKWDKVHKSLLKLTDETEDELYSLVLECGCNHK